VSSDNYIYIRRYRGKYVVTNESASDDRPAPIERGGGNRGVFFDDPQAALEYAHAQYSEYGLEFGPGLQMEARLVYRPPVAEQEPAK
jgi:hypothetical protein